MATRLNAKIEVLLSRYETLDRENAEIKARLARCEKELERKDTKLKELEKQTDILRLKEAFLGTSDDRTQARRKIARLIREIDACVNLLNE